MINICSIIVKGHIVNLKIERVTNSTIVIVTVLCKCSDKPFVRELSPKPTNVETLDEVVQGADICVKSVCSNPAPSMRFWGPLVNSKFPIQINMGPAQPNTGECRNNNNPKLSV